MELSEGFGRNICFIKNLYWYTTIRAFWNLMANKIWNVAVTSVQVCTFLY
jgi:hypothetical protein